MSKKEEIAGKFRKFMDSIAEKDAVAVLHHTDPDGVCSGVIISKLVEKKRGRKPEFHLNQGTSEIAVKDETVGFLKSSSVNKVIIVDLGVDQEPEGIKKIEAFADILVLDHHKIYNDISSKKTTFIKPQLFSDVKPGAYAAAKLCFDMSMGYADVSELDWVAAVGIIGDCGFEEWKKFLDDVFKKHSIEKKPEIFETELGKTASLISDAECFDSSKAHDAFEVVYSAKEPKDVLESELKKYREAIESEIEYWTEHLAEFAEATENMIFYLLKSKYRIKGAISTRLSLAHKDKTIIVMQDIGNMMLGISARRRDEKIAMNELLEKATEGLEGSNAGGHVPAAGGRIMKKDFNEFKKRIFELAGNGQV